MKAAWIPIEGVVVDWLVNGGKLITLRPPDGLSNMYQALVEHENLANVGPKEEYPVIVTPPEGKPEPTFAESSGDLESPEPSE